MRILADSLSSNLNATPRRRPAAIEPLEARRLLTSVVVNTAVDAVFPPSTGLISLRSAIATANASTSPTTITFSPTVFATPQTITMNGNYLELSNTAKATTVTAPSVGLTLDGNNANTIVLVDSGVTASFSNITFTKGGSGAIVNSGGTITLVNDAVSNSIIASDGYGGGITNNGTATLTDVTISGNTESSNGDAGDGGGIRSNGTLTMTNVTITGNNSGYNYGAGGAAIVGGTATLTNVTIVNNTGVGPNADTGGVKVDNGVSVTIANSMIAGNNETNGVDPDVFGNFASIGYNIVGKTDGGSGFNSLDLTGTVAKPFNAKLGSLANNGGLTQTILPLTGSPAIGAGLVAYVPKGITTDQRGLPRIVNGKVDIGAVEVQSVAVTTITLTAPAAQTATVGVSKTFSLGSFTETNATGPYTATIVWGDGTANTTIKLTAAGTITATAHTYAKAATDTVSVTVTDSAGHTSNKATFAVTVSAVVVNNAVISGTVFNDVNADKKLDDGELGLGGYIVFIDLKNTGKFATGDPTATTAANGTFSFTGLAAGTYKIAVESLTGETLTTPAVLTLTLKAGATYAGNLFGEKANA